MRSLLKLTPLVLISVAACAGGDIPGSIEGDLGPAQVSASIEARVTHALPPGGSSTASIRTLPDATCTVRPEGEAVGANPHLQLYSDDTGIARLGLHDNGGIEQSGNLYLDCADSIGNTITHTLVLNVINGARGQSPAVYASASARPLPALDKAPLELSDEEVAARGYPPRPDAVNAPAQYQKWLALVNSQPAVIAPRLVANPSRTHGPSHTDNSFGTSNNWSGYVISTPASAVQYGEIFGAWSVPRGYAQSGFWHLNHSSLWVGIDGWGTPDVVQAGTDQNTETVAWVQVSSYDAWTEWYPLSSQDISNFPVNPGDEIYTWVWVGNAAGAWMPKGGVGWFLVWNTTQNVITPHLSTAAPSGTVFNGHQAEWIMERPTVNGSLATLTDYATAEVTDAWAYDFADKAHYYTSDTSVGLSMYNGSDLLSSVAPVDSMSMEFTWHNYQ